MSSPAIYRQPSERGYLQGSAEGAGARRRHLMYYVVGAVSVSVAICIGAAVRVATRAPDAEPPSVRSIAASLATIPMPAAVVPRSVAGAPPPSSLAAGPASTIAHDTAAIMTPPSALPARPSAPPRVGHPSTDARAVRTTTRSEAHSTNIQRDTPF
jgi:hypothetical protein